MTDTMETCNPDQLPTTKFDIGDRVLIRHSRALEKNAITVGTVIARVFRHTGNTASVGYVIDTPPVIAYTLSSRPELFTAEDLEHYDGRFL